MSEIKQITRKDFLKGMGYTAVSVAAVGSLSGLLTGCTTSTAEVDTTQTPEWPFKYEKIDPAVVEARAYQSYNDKGGWGSGVADGFFGTLADEVGYPFNQIPVKAFTNYAGGFTKSSLCGALGAAAACIGAVCEGDKAKKILGELQNWYVETAFPIYQPANMGLPQTVSDTILCKDSVGKFLETSGFAAGSPEHLERCGGLTGDVAKKMVELLNSELA